MPQRLLRPGIRQSKRWNRIGYFEQTLYVRLITLVDDYGRYEADPELIRSEAFPYGDPNGDPIPVPTIDSGLLSIASKCLLTLYEHDGKQYLQLTRWKERARSESRYPGPQNGDLLTNDSKCQQMMAPSPSPSPSPKPEPEPAFATAHTPSWEEFWEYCKMHGLAAERYARDKFLAAESDNWKGKSKWTAYADRCRAWWEGDGRPMSPQKSKRSSPSQDEEPRLHAMPGANILA